MAAGASLLDLRRPETVYSSQFEAEFQLDAAAGPYPGSPSTLAQ
jgi:hypothetical protein